MEAFLSADWAQAMERMLAQLAETPAIVLLRGEPGTGKDVMARLIHQASSRRRYPFVKINCACVLPERLASELFGHERGAFPGATRRTLGKVEFAHRGTLYLDEIGALPRGLQPKLLQLFQTQGFSRLGGQEVRRADVQILASTTQPLVVPAGCKGFWLDAHRLKVVDILLPPLRERQGELPDLARWFLARFNARYHRAAALSAETLALFREYSWPGNIRELEGMVRELVVTGECARIHAEIRARLRRQGPPRRTVQPA